MKNELIMAINNICVDRELKPQVVLEAIEAALVSAHRRRFGTAANIQAKVNSKTGEIKIFIEREVVAEVVDDHVQISFSKPRAIDTRPIWAALSWLKIRRRTSVVLPRKRPNR